MAELADATDLKSVDLQNREGSSPSIPKSLHHFQEKRVAFLTKVFKYMSLSLKKRQR